MNGAKGTRKPSKAKPKRLATASGREELDQVISISEQAKVGRAVWRRSRVSASL